MKCLIKAGLNITLSWRPQQQKADNSQRIMMMSRSAFVMTYFLPDLHPEKLTKHLLCANQNVYSGLASWILKANFSISPQKVRINQFVIFKNDFVWLGELRLWHKQKITTLYLSSAVVSFFLSLLLFTMVYFLSLYQTWSYIHCKIGNIWECQISSIKTLELSPD